MRISTTIGLVLLAATTSSGSLSAQQPNEHERWAGATWVDDLNFLSANALIGGVTAGITSYLREGSFVDGFAKGALGGGVVYAGKRIAAARFSGAGLIGRQIGAVGSSITLNAALGGGLLDTLMLPLGPVWAVVPYRSMRNAQFRLDLAQSSWLLAGLLDEHLDLDWGLTLSAGAPVFRTDGGIGSRGEPSDGVAVGGVIVISRWAGPHEADVLAHERVHVLQTDFLRATVGLPVERWVRRRLRVERVPLMDHLVVGLGQDPLHFLLTRPWGRSRNLIEVEATFLEVR